jgi:ribose transport system substrate-binding protein
MKRQLSMFLAILLVASLVLTGCATKPPANSSESGAPGTETPGTGSNLPQIPNAHLQSGEFAEGPNGETPVPADEITLTDEQYAKIKEMGLTAALLWAGSGEWYNAMTDGAKEEFEKMGIEIAAQSDAQFDPSKQATDVETAMALSPDIIFTLPVDPVSGTRAFQPAVDAGVKIVFADNGVNDYKAGEQYVSICTGDQYGMGRAAAELMSEAIGGSGKIGVIYYDVDFLVTNNRDNEFIRTIQKDYPDIEIVSMMGFAEESATGDVAAAMFSQNPDLDGVYVSWDVAAEPVVAELRANGMKDVKMVTYDLGGNNDLDMAQKGNTYGKVADMPFQIGATMAKLAALSLLGEEAPPYVVSGTVKMTVDNMVEAWNTALNKNPDGNVMQALGK